MNQPSPARVFALAVAVGLGEALLTIGLSMAVLSLTLRGEATSAVPWCITVGGAALVVACRVAPWRLSMLYGLALRPLAGACLVVVSVTLERWLAGRPVSPSLIAVALLAALVGGAAIVAARRANARSGRIAAWHGSAPDGQLRGRG